MVGKVASVAADYAVPERDMRLLTQYAT